MNNRVDFRQNWKFGEIWRCAIDLELWVCVCVNLRSLVFMFMFIFMLIFGDEDGLGGMFDCGVIRLVVDFEIGDYIIVET